jgi:hypothetical protein
LGTLIAVYWNIFCQNYGALITDVLPENKMKYTVEYTTKSSNLEPFTLVPNIGYEEFELQSENHPIGVFDRVDLKNITGFKLKLDIQELDLFSPNDIYEQAVIPFDIDDSIVIPLLETGTAKPISGAIKVLDSEHIMNSWTTDVGEVTVFLNLKDKNSDDYISPDVRLKIAIIRR